MNKHLLAIIVTFSVALAACTNQQQGAGQILSKAREALSEARYGDARRMIDSLRTTYPKAFDERRAALVLADSVELLEARAEAAAVDSLITFKTLELADAKARFTLEKIEKYQSQGYYVLPRYAGNKSAFTFFPEVEESGKMLLVAIDAQRKYSFTEVPISDEGYLPYLKGLDLADEQQQEIAACYQLAQLFSEHQALAEQQEKALLKIKFFERKLTQE